MPETRRTDSVIVVGAGDVGLLNALMIRQFSDDVRIRVIDDFDADPPALGKATTDGFVDTFHEKLDVDRKRFFTEAKPVWKLSAEYRDWCGEDCHITFDDAEKLPILPDRKLEEFQYRYEEGELRTFGQILSERDRTPFLDDGEYDGEGLPEVFPSFAYHLDTEHFNDFLEDLCRERDVELVDDRIVTVNRDDDWITSIESETAEYEADLYLDATGFGRQLAGGDGAEYVSFPCPLDSAAVALAPLDLADVEPRTVFKSGSAGWCWQIDTYTGRDLGYVYSSEHIDDDEAIEEFLELSTAPLDEDDVNLFKFDSGRLKRPWRGNCIAVGNAAGFIEPLEATAITIHIMLADTLRELLDEADGWLTEGLRETYNREAGIFWDGSLSYVSSRYRFTDRDSDFWQQMAELGPEPHPQFEKYQKTGFVAEPYTPVEKQVFRQDLYSRFFSATGVPSEFHETIDVTPDDDVAAAVQQDIEEDIEIAEQTYSYEEIYDVLAQ